MFYPIRSVCPSVVLTFQNEKRRTALRMGSTGRYPLKTRIERHVLEVVSVRLDVITSKLLNKLQLNLIPELHTGLTEVQFHMKINSKSNGRPGHRP
jgi:hypothetical protein